jgi:LAO/AO transport system kinase
MIESATGLARDLLRGNRRALARLLSAVENAMPQAAEAMETLYSHAGRAHIIGITGAPGTGKSTLVSALARTYRKQGKTVGIIAVDPTSPFTGGAILGDRIRMRDLSGDSGIFIRSMATRGSLGGLAATTRDAARLMDAAGFDVIMIETVGAGQNEVAIAQLAQTTLVVDAPGMGDEVQAIKAGILEIADILVVNKADRAGAQNTVRALRLMVETGHPAIKSRWIAHHGELPESAIPVTDISLSDSPLWIPPILETVAHESKGVDDLLDQIAAHKAFLETNDPQGNLERAQLEIELLDRLRETLLQHLFAQLPAGTFEAAIQQIHDHDIAPHEAVQELMKHLQPKLIEA